MFYRIVRAVVGFALRLFYRVRVSGPPAAEEGPVIFIGNHPNALIDPALVFIITRRQVTFLAKAPLFQTPLIGQLLKGMGALAVYRKQDDPSQMDRNEGTLDAAADALAAGRAITLFPEGKSHSEPELAELKTGAARIALRAVRKGASTLKVIPVGLTYAEKDRFRSEVLIEIGEPLEVAPMLPATPDDEPDAVRALTDRMTAALKKVTFNLESWEDLPLVKTAEELYAFKLGERANDPERLRRFADGLRLFRRERPEQLANLRGELVGFQRRLRMVKSATDDLPLQYRPTKVTTFVLRNLAAVVFGFPLFALGVALFSVPFLLSRWLPGALNVEHDVRGTAKFAATLLLAPIWIAGLCWAAYLLAGPIAAVCVAVAAIPFAAWTRYFFERRRTAVRDARTFFVLGLRRALKQRLLAEGEKLAAEVHALAEEYRPRVTEPASLKAG